MPVIELQRVRSFSSEDKKFPADNLLKGDGFKKWKSSANGEKQVSLVLEFDKPHQINSIDIGNEGSAFVEVLVARSSEKDEPDFQVLVVASSFMNPQESKSSSNLNRVRMFDKEKMTKSLLGQKWDLAKVVCTQPFNKNTQYGLSFIKFHAPGNNESENKSESSVTSPLGFFKIKEKPKEEVKIGSAFAAYKRQAPDLSSNASASASARSVSKFADEVLAREAAAVRAKVSESPRSEESKTPKRKLDSGENSTPKRSRDTPSPRNTPKLDKNNERRRDEPRKTPNERKRRSPSPERRRKRSPSPERRRKRSPSPERRRRRSPSPERRRRRSSSSEHRGRKSPIVKPFSKLMCNVVFALSGYQNPERGDIRDEACEMGATYKPDWGKGCTHLICAFPNTPKFNSVKGKGRIVDAKWVHRCYKEKKLLPWRRFKVGRARTPPNSSDEECIAEEIAPKKEKKLPENYEAKRTPEVKKEPPVKKETPAKKEIPVKKEIPTPDKPSTSSYEEPSTSSGVKKNAISYGDSDDSIYGQDTDVEDMDTDEEIERIKNSRKSPQPGTSKTGKNEKPNLPDFFQKLTFLLYGELTPGERKILKRLIVAYRGEISEYMSDDVTHVVTNNKWDANFDKALGENVNLKFVKLEWVFECDRMQDKVGIEKYCVDCD